MTTTSNPNNLNTEYRLVSATSYNLPSVTTPGVNTPQTDCPRFTKRFDEAADWASGVTTNYLFNGSYGEVTAPNGTKTREYYMAIANGAWCDGLVYKTELSDVNTMTIKRTTLATWDSGGSTTWGPRVLNATVTDNENNSSRYSEYEYGSYNLPVTSKTWKVIGSAMTMLQQTTTSYLLSSTYITGPNPTTTRWIAGLPSEVIGMVPNDAAGTSFTTLSRSTYQYDQTAATATTSGTLSNHNTAAFGTGFNARGNLTNVTTWDTVTPANSIATTTKYNTAGSPIEQSLPDNNLSGRKSLISYTDSFSDNAAITNTFAYPTTVTDPDGNIATVKYRHDLGAVTKTYDPKMIAANLANGTDKGILTKYDQYGRLKRVENEFTTGYSRYAYDPALVFSQSFTKADDAGTELYTTTVFDGHGRTRANVTAHPGSTGGNRAVYNIFNNMGQAVQTSNPTEINSVWTPTGDDVAGYIWSQQTYDYKGRPLVTTHQDNSTMTYEYGGCGCTGEATVTITDEVGRKTRRISDAFLDNAMQVDKTEVLNMNSTTVYSTTATVTKPLERKSYALQASGELTDYSACPAGNCNSATKQQTTTMFDGYGRTVQKQSPQQSGATPYTALEYYNDGSLKKSTDARGANATLLYNARGLTTNINYGTPPSGVEVTPNVSFTFDANGNRLTMTDGMGVANYAYDTLSRLTSESRTLTGLSGSFAINYEYYQSTGQLKKITDPFGDSVSYTYDLTGRTTGITGSPFAGITNYVSGVTFRAGDQTKSLTSGTTTASMGYDSMLRVNNFQSGTINANYGYYADNRLYQVTSSNNNLLNRYFDYNNPNGALTYTTANGDTNANQYYQTMAYDYLGNQTSRGGRYWWMATGTTFSGGNQFLNNKIVSGSDSGTVVPTYDAEGNVLGILQGTEQTMGPEKYDVAGRVVEEINAAQKKYFDGDGNMVKDAGESKYLLYSRVLGGKQLTTMNLSGTKLETSVFGNGQLLARQQKVSGVDGVLFIHRDPHNTIDYTTSEIKWVDAVGTTGKAANSTYISQYQAGMFGHPDPSTYYASSGQFYPGGGGNQKPGQSTVCYENYVKVSCSSLNNSIRNGGIVWMRVSSQSLTGYDEESSNLLSSANISATSRNGKPTGGGSTSISRRKIIIPGGEGNARFILGGDEFALTTGESTPSSVAYEYVSVVSGGGFEATQQTGVTASSQSLSSAISSFGPGCTIWFGGADIIKKLAADAEKKIKVVSVGGPEYNSTIPNTIPTAGRTYKSFWEKKVPAGTVAAVVSYSGKDEGFGRYMSIVLGPAFLTSSYKNPWLSSSQPDLYPSTPEGFAAFQKDALRHEWSHIYSGKYDVGLAEYWQLTARGYEDTSNDNTASVAIQKFIKNDCRDANWKKK